MTSRNSILLLCLIAAQSSGFVVSSARLPTARQRVKVINVVLVESWYDQGIRLSSDSSPKAPQRETAEEAWAKAPEGSFLSPALVVGLIAAGVAIKVLVLEGGSPF